MKSGVRFADMKSLTLKTNGIRRVCGNIYGCSEAAKFLAARALSAHKDRCGSCADKITYLDFMQHGLILSCRMCTLLSGAQGSQPGDALGECFEQQGRHCPLCGFEYASLIGKGEDWVRQASDVIRCFLGGRSRYDLAESFYALFTKEGCHTLQRNLGEIMAMLDESKRGYLTRRIREVTQLLNVDLLSTAKTG
jgi:hypothetical protein